MIIGVICICMVIIGINKWTAHLISSSGPPANVQLHDHDAQCISVRVCFPQGSMAFSRPHNVSDVGDMLADVSNSDLQWSHLKERNCWVDTLLLFCLFIDRGLSGGSACRSPGLNCVRLHSVRDSRKLSRREHKIWKHILTDRASEVRSPTSHTAWALE